MASGLRMLSGGKSLATLGRPRSNKPVLTGQIDSVRVGFGIARAFADEFGGPGFNSRWKATTGSWSISNGNATTSTAASSYPMITFDSGTKFATVRSETGTGAARGFGVSFWVKDSSNWWAAVVNMTSYSCQTGTTSGCCACGDNGCGPDGSCNCFSCAGGGCIAPCTLVGNAGGCSYPVFGTCYTYTLRLLSSVNGVVTQQGTANLWDGNVGAGGTPSYVQVTISKAGVVTATSALTSGGSTATITSTPSGALQTTRHGLIIAPVTVGTQALDAGRFTYSPA